ncbi:transporter substrate-binding domain-containing protein [Bacillus fonticola]|uniref:transporter substrate-binding domain-containing protein n=1 Tax=Bacillus fonticola TaxID=2728853 RepID=UPI0014737F49|nr:transporter substrate-binding domain-containing protein [Bacillus fonticola]
MKKTWKTLGMAVLSIGILAGCGSQVAQTESGATIIEEGKLTFAVSGEFKPFSYMDENNELTGYDVEVGNAIAEELGLEPVAEKIKFASIISSVKSDRVDIAVASHTINDKRLEEVNFSTPYYYSGPQIFTRPDSDIETVEDLTDMEVAVSKGSTYQEDAAEYTDNIATYDSDITALRALADGRHDAVITDFITGKEAIGEGFEIEGRELLGRSEQAVAVSKEDEQLLEDINEALETLREDGTLTELSKKYFGEDISVDPEE